LLGLSFAGSWSRWCSSSGAIVPQRSGALERGQGRAALLVRPPAHPARVRRARLAARAVAPRVEQASTADAAASHTNPSTRVGSGWVSTASTAMHRAMIASLGVEPPTLHACRHGYAALMIAAGVNVKALSTFMGHANIRITLDQYGHLLPGAEDEAAGLLDAFLGRQLGAPTATHSVESAL
jgi:integrase